MKRYTLAHEVRDEENGDFRLWMGPPSEYGNQGDLLMAFEAVRQTLKPGHRLIGHDHKRNRQLHHAYKNTVADYWDSFMYMLSSDLKHGMSGVQDWLDKMAKALDNRSDDVADAIAWTHDAERHGARVTVARAIEYYIRTECDGLTARERFDKLYRVALREVMQRGKYVSYSTGVLHNVMDREVTAAWVAMAERLGPPEKRAVIG